MAATPAPVSPTAETARLRKKMHLAIALLLLSAAALVALPLPRLPFPVRLGLAAFDVIIAAVLWLVGRQKLDGK